VSQRSDRAAERNADDLMRKANVTGVASGDKEVLVLVTERLPRFRLRSEDVVPNEVDGVPTKVIEVGRIVPKHKPGTSIGLRNAGTGTLGAVVRDSRGITYGLTNNHVAADSNRAVMLSTIHSPGNADGLGIRIGRLDRYAPIYFDRDNYVDAALFRLDRATGNTHANRLLTPQVGWNVSKVGRTTGYTLGKVLGRNATISVDFGSQGVARFVNQIITTYMLDSGDSGSLVVTSGGYPCALGFAGSDTISIANPIRTVVDTLSFSF